MFNFVFDLKKEDLLEAVRLIDKVEVVLNSLEEDFDEFYLFNSKYQVTVILHHGEVEEVKVEEFSWYDFKNYLLAFNLDTNSYESTLYNRIIANDTIYSNYSFINNLESVQKALLEYPCELFNNIASNNEVLTVRDGAFEYHCGLTLSDDWGVSIEDIYIDYARQETLELKTVFDLMNKILVTNENKTTKLERVKS